MNLSQDVYSTNQNQRDSNNKYPSSSNLVFQLKDHEKYSVKPYNNKFRMFCESSSEHVEKTVKMMIEFALSFSDIMVKDYGWSKEGVVENPDNFLTHRR